MPHSILYTPAWNAHALLTCDEMRRAEQETYAQGVESYTLMCRAGEAVAQHILDRSTPRKTIVLCGPGNNGGDGYVCAEALRGKGWDITVAILQPATQALPPDAARAAQAWQGPTVACESLSFDDYKLVVDALFGAGLKRPLEGLALRTLEKLAQAATRVVAVDLPSGLDGDSGKILGRAPQAQSTVTFFRKKRGHLLEPGASLCGEIIVADIGIAPQTLAKLNPLAAENAPELWHNQFPYPTVAGHKYTRGHALIYGSAAMTGAARLAARAAQRMGAGVVTVASPTSALPIYAATLESGIVQPVDELRAWQCLFADSRRNVILIGPGLGIGALQRDMVLAALESGKTCVLDADALTNFENEPQTLLRALHPGCVLTPHEGEFARIFETRIDSREDKMSRATKAADLAHCCILLKGADTMIAAPEGHAVVNHNAPPWLATAGAGDVLAGLITGLTAQKMPIFQASCAAAWIHGDIAARFGSGLIAEDLVDGIPAALKSLSVQSSIV
ncbi:MAG: NAD(P)H-hydrate dehydratase [Bdellovibrionales bacterium]